MQHYIMLQRNLLYTAITRGRRLVVLVGDPRALGHAVQSGERRHRWSSLLRRIRDGCPG
jgi:exodeoxyribonuclease V alpha subunit